MLYLCNKICLSIGIFKKNLQPTYYLKYGDSWEKKEKKQIKRVLIDCLCTLNLFGSFMNVKI